MSNPMTLAAETESEALHFAVNTHVDVEDEELISEEISAFLDESFRPSTDDAAPIRSRLTPPPEPVREKAPPVPSQELFSQEEFLTPFYYAHISKPEAAPPVSYAWENQQPAQEKRLSEKMQLLESRYEEALQTITHLQEINEKLETRIRPLEMDNQNLLEANQLLEEKINELIDKLEEMHHRDSCKDKDIEMFRKLNRQLLEENVQLTRRKKISWLNLFGFAI